MVDQDHNLGAHALSQSSTSEIKEVGRSRYQRLLIQKRTPTLLKKAYELAYLCGSDVCLVINHSRAKVVYYSVEDTQLLPSDNELETLPHDEWSPTFWLTRS